MSASRVDGQELAWRHQCRRTAASASLKVGWSWRTRPRRRERREQLEVRRGRAVDAETREAGGDWHYWLDQGYVF